MNNSEVPFCSGLLLGLVVGIGATTALWCANADMTDPVPQSMRQMKDRQTITMGWDPEYEHLARFYSNSRGWVVMYQDRARLRKQRERVRKLLDDFGGKGFGSEAWFDEQEKAEAKRGK